MKKVLSVILCLLLLCCSAAYAEEEEAGEDSFLLKVWDRSGLEMSYLRFDLYGSNPYHPVDSCEEKTTKEI